MALAPEDYRERKIQIALSRGLPVPLEDRAWYKQRLAMRRGLLTYGSFSDYVAAMNPRIGDQPGLLEYEHIPKLLDIGERVVQRELMNVIVMISPRYFKSEVFSRQLPAYFLHKHQRKTVALSCYADHLALELSEQARSNYTTSGGQLTEEVAAKSRWRTSNQGEMWACGVGAGNLGRGYHLGITDDPIDPEQSVSLTFRRRFARWWEQKWLRGAEPGAQYIFVMQRLGPEDPIDYLFRREVGEKVEKSPMHWHVVVLDEVKSDEPLGRWSGPRGLPPTCTIEPDDRPTGAVLAPTRFSPEEVKRKHEQLPSHVASAQRQQRPMSPSGDFWQKKWFDDQSYLVLPDNAYNGGWDWDTAYTKEERNSASAGVLSYRGPAPKDRPEDFPIYIEDVWWDWLEFPEMIAHLQSVNGPHFVEQKASGKSIVQTLAKYKIPSDEVTVRGGKLQRASAAQPTVSSRRVFINERVYDKLLWGERQGLLRVTSEALVEGGEGLDLNDAFVQSIWRHMRLGGDGVDVAFR